MASLPQIRGAILEEVLLYLLQRAGYRTVEQVGGDPTLQPGSAGLEVLGRGHWHQIDAIADYVVAQPFAYPQRLLLEAKFYSERTRTKRVGIEVARNAVGVMKDVSEYWVTRHGAPGARPHRRYHYQYALFSASGFATPTQHYAFAQDIYLIELQDNQAVRPILDAIRQLAARDVNTGSPRRYQARLGELRETFRHRLRGEAVDVPVRNPAAIEEIVQQCRQLDGALLGMINGQFPVFLVPLGALDELLRPYQNQGAIEIPVRIRFNDEAWFLEDQDERHLFAFDLPKALFEMYARSGQLEPMAALDLKQQMMSRIDATLTPAGGDEPPIIVRFTLDQNWLAQAREHTQKSLPPEEDIPPPE